MRACLKIARAHTCVVRALIVRSAEVHTLDAQAKPGAQHDRAHA